MIDWNWGETQTEARGPTLVNRLTLAFCLEIPVVPAKQEILLRKVATLSKYEKVPLQQISGRSGITIRLFSSVFFFCFFCFFFCCALCSVKHFKLTALACFVAWVSDGFSPECTECFVEPCELCVNLITEFYCMFSFLQQTVSYLFTGCS